MKNCGKRFIFILSMAMLLEAAVIAGEKSLLDMDFSIPTWREFTTQAEGNITVSGTGVRLAPEASLKTVLLPVRQGERVIVSLDASSKGAVSANGNAGLAVIRLYNKAKSEFAHQDICAVSGNSNWQTYRKEITVDDSCSYIGIELANFGSAGEVEFRNLKILHHSDMIELVSDSNFDDVLGVNCWFFRRLGFDWDQFPFFKEPGHAEVDAEIFATGKRSLRLSNGAITLESKAFAYNGEKLAISGWLRGDKIKQGEGKPGWATAGVQVIGLDALGIPICHRDLELLQGTQPWHYRRTEFSFVGSVKKVQVVLRIFDKAQGTLWLDGIRLLMLPNEDVLPFHKDAANVTVDLSRPQEKEINHRAWAGVCGDWINREDVQQCLPMLKAAGFEYIRMRDLANSLDMYPRDNQDGSPAYNWTNFDKLFDVLVKQYHFVPIITLGHTPKALDRPGAPRNWTNSTAPSDMKKWGAFNEAIFEHVIERYGKENVSKWLWEIWNEPNVPSTHGDYIGNEKDFADLCEQVYLAKERVEKKYGTRILMGLTSGSSAANAVIIQRLKATGKENLIDHVSYHNYAGAESSIRIIKGFIEEEKALLRSLSDRKDYLVGQTEWNCTSMIGSTFRPDMPWNATLVVKMARVYLDSALDYSTFFHVVDHAEQKIPPPLFETGDLGLFTRPNEWGWGKKVTHVPIPKPAYNAFVFLNELKGGKRLSLKSGSDPVDGIAALMPDGAIRIVLASYDEDITRQPYTTAVTLELKGLPPNAKYRCTKLWAADEQYGNSYGEWVKLGKTPISDVTANEKILAASKYAVLIPPPLDGKDGELSLEIPLPSPGIRMLELTPDVQ